MYEGDSVMISRPVHPCNLRLRCLLITTLIALPFLTAAEMRAQDDVRLNVTAADTVAATYSVSNFRYHIFPANTPAGKPAVVSRNLGTPVSGHPKATSNSGALTPTIPSVPAPGFYGEDLVYFGGAR